MKKIVFVTNLPSPYRVDFFNELGKYCELTVVYERSSSSERNSKWKGKPATNYKEIYSESNPKGVDQSVGNKIKNIVRKLQFDVLIITGYSSPSIMKLIFYCRMHKIPYYVEYDGGFNKKDRIDKRFLKRFLLRGAIGHLTTCEEHKKYLMSLGIDLSKIFKYPFSSISESDIKKSFEISKECKSFYKNKLGFKEKHIILSVGRFSYEKGKEFDILLNIAKNFDNDVGFCIVGDEPTQEFVARKVSENLNNVHFVGFKSKDDLYEYYAAADIFVLLTRGDVWGLVVNEALSFGLPVITTDKCNSGLELVKNNVNGFIENVTDEISIVNDICSLVENENLLNDFSCNASKSIVDYTIENMAEEQIKILVEGVKRTLNKYYKNVLNIKNDFVILAIGQFIYRKGFDLLLKAFKEFDNRAELIIVGGNPTIEYKKIVDELCLKNIYFESFKTKEEIQTYYLASDLFVLPTREDIWGLVVNEALSFGIPVITTNKCIAGLEMIRDGINGYVCDCSVNSLINSIGLCIRNREMHSYMKTQALLCMKNYTIEEMVNYHKHILKI